MGCVHADGGNPNYVCARCEREGAPPAPLPTPAALALLLHLGYLRSVFLVGQAVWCRFPTEESWTAAVASPELQQMLDTVAQMFEDIRALKHVEGVFSEEQLQAAASAQYARALDAVALIADDLSVDARDLLNVLLHV